jgi:hypothetical protein
VSTGKRLGGGGREPGIGMSPPLWIQATGNVIPTEARLAISMPPLK